jgi:branched-chain amino acid transport system substrate-binding protein
MNHILLILLFLHCAVCLTDGQAIAQLDAPKKPTSVFDLPAEFTGWKEYTQNPELIDEIRIGLFLPADSLDKLSLQLMRAAEMAIEEINLSGGYNGIPYRLINRWSFDPWGAGSKEMIKLVYQDSVWAVIGSIDGNATHVAEQIATKAWLPLISPISADPTLTYIRIPWIFRLPPDYKAQAEVIIREGFRYGHRKKIGLITENSHDGRIFVNELKEVMSQNNIFPTFHFEISKSDLDFHSIVQRAISFNPRSIIICLSKENIIKLLSEMEALKQHIDVSIPWIPGLDCTKFAQSYSGNIYCIEPFLRSPNPTYENFASRYQKNYKSKPLFGAAYIYDAVHILDRALQRSGLNRAKLRDRIGDMNTIQGVTGKITWDNGGGNQTQPVLKVVR